jgi:hypothetical protein
VIRRWWLAAAVVLVCGCAVSTRSPAVVPVGEEILFIGNSYTYVNDLPGTLAELSRADGHPLWVESVVAAGLTLEQHWGGGSGEAVKKIAERRWSWVVLQEQSLRPIEAPEKLVEFTRLLDARIKASGARTALYVTWPRSNAPANQAKLTEAYARAARETGATLVPVGVAWALALAERPSLALYDEDGSHPSPRGTYLAALTFRAVLLGRTQRPPPARADDPADELEVRALLQSAAAAAASREAH